MLIRPYLSMLGNVSRELHVQKSTHFELLDGHRSRNYRCGLRKVYIQTLDVDRCSDFPNFSPNFFEVIFRHL